MATRNFVPRGDGEGSIGTTVKNWAGGFFKKLAVGAITTAVTVLTPAADANNQQPATTGWVRAQFQSILTTVLSAAGLKYNIAQNGYICFGALFGGLILQWGIFKLDYANFKMIDYWMRQDIVLIIDSNILSFAICLDSPANSEDIIGKISWETRSNHIMATLANGITKFNTVSVKFISIGYK